MEISNDVFVETSSDKHRKVVKFVWSFLNKKGLIYKKKYTGLYCVGDEAFVTQSQLREGGLCPNHDEKPIEMDEENYFFKASEFTDDVRKFILEADIRPNFVRKEMLNLIKDGLEDLSISREKTTLPWGVPVPNDDSQVVYIWFEALINYITAVTDDELIDAWDELGPGGEELEDKIIADWQTKLPIYSVFLGKDIARFHLLFWQAMLLALDLPTTKHNLVHGFINDENNEKMSKSKGNVILPEQLLEKFGTDGTRFLLIHEVNFEEDTAFSVNRCYDLFNSHLADNLGNLVVRVSNLIEKLIDGVVDADIFLAETGNEPELDLNLKQVYAYLEDFNPQLALTHLFSEISKINKYLEQTKPWELTKNPANSDLVLKILSRCAVSLKEVGKVLSIFMPSTGDEIYTIFNQERITKARIMFPKIDS